MNNVYFNTEWKEIRKKLGGAIFQYQCAYNDKCKRAEVVKETGEYLDY